MGNGKADSYDDKFDESENGSFAAKMKRKQQANGTTMGRVYSHASTSLLGTDTGYGDSRYDKGLNWATDVDPEDVEGSINENRAQSQSGLIQAAAMIPRAATKAIAEVAKIPGVIGGVIAAPFVEDGQGMDMMFNNAWIKQVDKLQQGFNEDLMPIYTAKAVKEGNLWDNITSTSFWATDGADGLGFIAGMMAPGALFEYAGLGGKLIGAAANSKKLANLTSMVGKAEEGTQVMKLMGMTGKNIDSGLAIMGNTILEAGAEAKGVGDDIEAKKPDFTAKYVNSQHYKSTMVQRMAQLDEQRRAGTITVDEYNKLSAELPNKVVDEAFNQRKATAMRDTFVSNVAILLGPNAIMHKAIWGKAAEKFEKTAEEGFKGIAKRAGKSLERVGEAFVSEGLWEEGSQTTVENLFTKRALAGQKKDANSFDLVGEFTKEYANTLATTEGQKAIFLGGALGGPMMSYQGRKEDVRNRKRTNAILDNIDKEILNFNTVFDNDIYKKKKDGSFKMKEDENGNEVRVLDNKKVREVAKNLNFTERQSALFDLAVQTGNTEVVDKIKKQAIFNLIMPAVYNGEAGLQALEQKLQNDSQFNEIVERDATSDSKDNSKTFVKETLENAKWLQKQKERFTDFSKDVIRIENKDATDTNKEEFFDRLSASYLNSKYALKNAENDLVKLQKKRDDAYNEAGADPLYDEDAEFPTGKMKPGVVTDEALENRAVKTRDFLQSNELIQSIEKEYKDKQKEIAAHKKDISEIWQGGSNIQEAFDEFLGKQKAEEKATSEAAIAKAELLIQDIEEAESKEELHQLLLPPGTSTGDYDRQAEQHVVNQVSNSIANDDSTQNIKSNLDKLKSLNLSSKQINDLIEQMQDILQERIDDQENLKEELFELLDYHYEEAKEVEDLLNKYQDELDDLVATQQRLMKSLAEEDKSPKGRNAKIIKQLIKETQDELDSVNDKIKEYNKSINELKKDLKQLNKEIDYIYNRYDQTNKSEFESIDDIINYLINSKSLFKSHRQDLGRLLANRFGTERRIEELHEAVDALENYKEVLEDTIKKYATIDSKIKKGTNMEEYKYLRDELMATSKSLFEAKQDLKENEAKLARLNKSINSQHALNELSAEEKFWNELWGMKKERVHPLAKNPYIANKIIEKEAELQDNEDAEKEFEEYKQTNLEETQKIETPEEVVEIVVPPVTEDESGDYQSESLPTKEDEDEEDEVEEGENMTQEEVEDELDSPQVGAKVISTNMRSGKALYPNLEDFVAYERTPRDKSNDKVTFSIGDIRSDQVEAAYNRLLSGTASAEDITLLKENLPIKVDIAYKENGKEKTVSSFIEAQTSDIKADQDSLDIFYKETMPLRSNIIDQAIANRSLEGISSNIVSQFPGILKVEERKEGEPVAKNSVLDLQVFDGMTKAEKIAYFQKNTGYVNWEGNLVSTLDKTHIIQTNIGIQAKGEVFLMIPQNNGEIFPLKLNVAKISEEKAEAVYEIVRSLSDVSQVVGKKTSFQAMTIDQFFKSLDGIDPDLSARIQDTLKAEIGFVKRTAKGDERNESLSRFLDLIIYHKSQNAKTGFNLTPDGNLHLGSLANHLIDGSGFEHALTITKAELDSPEAREIVMQYVQYKRHNILITRDSANQFVFNNPAYAEYLLNKNNPLLTTNAVVNQPTFQGYSNIYLNQNVKNSKPVAKKEEVKKPEPPKATPVDIETKRKENDSLGKSILQKLKYKNQDRLSNGNVKGGQSGWKMRFNIKNPKTNNSYYDGNGKDTLVDKDYNERAETLINFLLNYFGSNEKADPKNLQKHYVIEDENGTKREPFKHLSGGEIGESDFTIYIGSAEDSLKFISDIRKNHPEILELLHAGNQSGDVKIDDIFKGRIEGRAIGFSGYHVPTNLNKVTNSDNFTFAFDGKRVNINYAGQNLRDISIYVEGGNRAYNGVFDKNLKSDFPELYKNIRNIIGFQLYGDYLQGSNDEFLKLTGVNKSNAKYNDKSTTKEVTTTTDEDGINLRTKSLFDAAIKAKQAKEENPKSKEDVKTDTKFLEAVFSKLDEDSKADVIMNLVEDLDVLDQFSGDAFEEKNITKTFKELMSIAKTKNRSIDEIKKICGF